MALLGKVQTIVTLARAGVIAPALPQRLLRSFQAIHSFGPTPAAAYTSMAARYPDRTAIIDEIGELTFAEVNKRTNALANAWSDLGVCSGDAIGILCRNHRGFIEAAVACSKLGAHAVYLNTGFAGPQLADVIEREEPVALVYDEEFSDFCAAVEDQDIRHYLAWCDDPLKATEKPSLEHLMQQGSQAELLAPREPGRVIILTSGTTGTPKGARRAQPKSFDPAAVLIEKIPLQARERTLIAAPMFHAWGFAHLTLGLLLGSTLVLQRRFEQKKVLEAIQEYECTALAVVPVMLQRIMQLSGGELAKYDTSLLRIIAASGSALPGDLALAVMDTFGDILYNMYGSTEVAWATVATPIDLRAAPGTAGYPPRGTRVVLYDEAGKLALPDETGRIFVGNEMPFEGYTGGGGKAVIDGLVSTGDVGHFDLAGRLFVDGRDDEMIISGGENVFPREVEDLLSNHPKIKEAAVVGVRDEEFGQRLIAFVVLQADVSFTVKQIQMYVRENLARFKIPRDVIFLQELPRTTTGKILKRELFKLGNTKSVS